MSTQFRNSVSEIVAPARVILAATKSATWSGAAKTELHDGVAEREKMLCADLHIVAVFGAAEAVDQNHERRAFSEAVRVGFAEEGGELIATAVCEGKSESGQSQCVQCSDRRAPQRVAQGLEVGA